MKTNHTIKEFDGFLPNLRQDQIPDGTFKSDELLEVVKHEFTWTDPSHCQNQSSWHCLEFSGQWICLGLSMVNSPRMTEGLLPGFRHSVKLLRWPLFWMHSMPSCLSGCYQSLVPDGKPVHFPGLKIELSSL